MSNPKKTEGKKNYKTLKRTVVSEKTCVCRICEERKEKINFPTYEEQVLMPTGKTQVYVYSKKICYPCQAKKQEETERRRFPNEEDFVNYRYEKSFKARMKRYGLTPEEAYAMLKDQEEECAICCKHIRFGRELARKDKACIDHCHKTGKVRGLLCTRCNTAAGMMDDDPCKVLRLKEYLTSHEKEKPG